MPKTLQSLTFLLLALVSSPSFSAAGPVEDAAALKQQAQRLWQARVQDDWGIVFDLLPPEEAAVTKRDDFVKYQSAQGPFRYLSAEVGDAFVDGTTGWVHVKYAVTARNFPGLAPTKLETWDIWQMRDTWRPIVRDFIKTVPSRPPNVRPAEEESILATRVHAFWEAMKAQDRAAVWQFLSPAAQQQVNRQIFEDANAKYLYVSHEIEWVEVNDSEGRAKVVVGQKLNDPSLSKMEPQLSVMFESWVKQDGQWYRGPKLDKDKKGSN